MVPPWVESEQGPGRNAAMNLRHAQIWPAAAGIGVCRQERHA